ncbi:MAG TPA: hypothetical protein HPP83_13195 [Candidatus Hydrogenedentes bacterium]|nr:hypothetical protein [Candidatus Hydrogenedentota bacterium]
MTVRADFWRGNLKRGLGLRHGFRIAALTLVSALIAGCGETPQNKAARGTYLVVSVIQDTERNLAELIALRRRQGWEVVVRQMNQPAPDDVKAAIAAEKSAHAALSHVLLVGSDALLPMVRMPNYKTQRYEKDLPILTDDAYGMPDDAGVPRLAVGRFPTDDGERLRRLAGKVVRYETELDSLSPHLFLLVGRQPADEQLAFGGFSAQRVVDNVSAAFIDGIRGVLEPNLKLRVRTAFPGNDHYPFEESAEVLREALARRPAM